MTEEIQQDAQLDTEVQDMVKRLSDSFNAAFALLVTRRNDARDAEFERLDNELMRLAEKSAALSQAVTNLESTLPAKTREAQREADALVLSGKSEQAAAVLAKAQKEQDALTAMRAQIHDLEDQGGAIQEKRKFVSADTLEDFVSEAKQLIRTAESGLFLQLLNGVWEYLHAQGFLFTGTFSLTAPEGSEDWKAGNSWYGNNGR
jgi:hypothetical protein